MRRLRQHDQWHVDAGLAELVALLGQSHAEVAGTPGNGGPGHRDRTVAVPVRLYDSTDRRWGNHLVDIGDIGRHRGEVHLDPRRPQPPRYPLDRRDIALGVVGFCAPNPPQTCRSHRLTSSHEPFVKLTALAWPNTPESQLATRSGSSPATRP